MIYFLIALPLTLCLQLRQDNSFTILHLSDLHFNYKEPNVNSNNVQVINKILSYTNPDITIPTGDTVSGYAYEKGDVNFFKQNWFEFIEPFLLHNQLYAYVQGNHDAQADLDGAQIMQLDTTCAMSAYNLSYSIFNYTNFVIPVYDSDGDLAIALWIMDSGGNIGCDSQISGGCVLSDQVQWFNTVNKELKQKYKNFVSLVFQHIPPLETLYQYNDYQVYGQKHEWPCCGMTNFGYVDALIEEGNILGLFYGHDHVNWYGGFYNGIELVYAIKTGYGSYGPYQGQKHGGRVLNIKQIKENNEKKYVFNHHIIYEDGEIVENEKPTFRNDQKQYSCDPSKSKLQVEIENVEQTLFQFGSMSLIYGLICIVLFYALKKITN